MKVWPGMVVLMDIGRQASVDVVDLTSGPLVARVAVGGFDEEIRIDDILHLAHIMDERIQRVMGGEGLLQPDRDRTGGEATDGDRPIFEPGFPAPGNIEAAEAARSEGFNLPVMVPTLEDLSDGAVVEFGGFVPEPDSLSSFTREFGAEGLFFLLGSSPLIHLGATVELHGSPLAAIGPVILLSSVGPEALMDPAGLGFDDDLGFISEDVQFESAEFMPSIGDASAASMMEMSTALGELDGYMVFFARRRITAQVFVIGLDNEVDPNDLVSLAQEMDARILFASP